jgi:hypothetical protein
MPNSSDPPELFYAHRNAQSFLNVSCLYDEFNFGRLKEMGTNYLNSKIIMFIDLAYDTNSAEDHQISDDIIVSRRNITKCLNSMINSAIDRVHNIAYNPSMDTMYLGIMIRGFIGSIIDGRSV